MLTYLLLSLILLTLFVSYKYILFNRNHISTTKKSLTEFFRFWLKPTPSDTRWEHFIDGKGTFQSSDQLKNNNKVFGGGISGSW